MLAHPAHVATRIGRFAALLGLPVALVLSMTALVTPAQAVAPVAPDALEARFPGGTSSLPILSWTRAEGAATYDVQLSTTPDFTSTLSTVNTVNLQTTPTAQLPVGQIWFRVRGKSSTSDLGDWSTSSFERTSIAAPQPVQPASGAVLEQPSSPALFTWRPVSGVTKYEIQISTDEAFTDPAAIKSYTSQTTGLVLPALQVPTATYWWRVRGQLGTGIFTAWSSSWSYDVVGLPPADVISPDDDVNQAVQDTVLRWTPVPGAAKYDIQISTDQNFLTVAHSASNITGTSYARPATLNNDQYYWRIRPVDASGNKRDWSRVPVWQFRRSWPDQPQLEYPANDAAVGNPFFFQWTPVALASRYTVQFSPNSTFSPPSSVSQCTTALTTFTPGPCWPGAAGTYYWRVIAQDEFTTTVPVPTTDAISAQVRRFTYSPETVRLSAPANGADVSVPTLRWHPVAGAAKYKVTATSVTGGHIISIVTASTSFTPRGVLDVDETYRWQVQTISEDKRVGAEVLPGGQRTFTVRAQDEATATRPEPTTVAGATFQRFPTLTWQAVTGASEYRVLIRKAGSSGFTRLAPRFEYPAGEAEDTSNLAPGDYQWYVESYTNGAYRTESSALGTFTIGAPPRVTGQRVALTGTTLGTDSCQASLPNECQNLRQTPVLSWTPQEDVGFYRLYLSYDRELTNLVSTFPTDVNSTTWTSREALPDSQAGSAYFWYVQPCTADGVCAALEHAAHAFNKRSAEVRLTTPAHGAVVENAVTLTWEDYLASQPHPDNLVDTALVTPARTEARRYKVQTATDENFQNVLETADVDQRSFTSYDMTYPEGPVFWRVQAIDGSNNPLTWSRTGRFDKASPAPTQTSPAAGAVVSGAEPLAWEALAFAASYDVEVYKNDDQVPSPANLVLSANAMQIALSLPKPLQVSDQRYRWRVRRVDAKGRKGRWSPLTPFTVVGPTPAPTAPLPGARLSPSEGIFQWGPLGEAETYRFERRLAGGSVIAETVTTAGLAWAPIKAIGDGDWQWRVTALDNAGSPLGTSAWRDFQVIAAPTAAAPPTITGPGRIGTTLTTTAVTWNLSGVTTTYQWLRVGSPIADATSAVYRLTSADEGRAITLRATGTKPGYSTGTTVSNAIVGATGDAPALTTDLLLQGAPTVGSVLTLRPFEWNQEDVATSYQWLRDDASINNGWSAAYQVTSADVGKTISVRVRGTKTGYTPATVTSNGVAATAAAAPAPTTAPTVSGTPRVGKTLQAHAGTWSHNPSFTYQWLRGGKPISSATGSTYAVGTTDAGRPLSVQITAQRAGYLSRAATTESVLVARLASTTRGTLAKTRIRSRERARYTVVVKVAGITAPSGTVAVYVGKKKVRTVRLATRHQGKVVVVLARMSKGRRTISAKYSGTTGVAPGIARGVRLSVTR